LVKSLAETIFQKLTRYEMPSVEKWIQPLFNHKPLSEGFDLLLIAAVVTQKNVIEMLLG